MPVIASTTATRTTGQVQRATASAPGIPAMGVNMAVTSAALALPRAPLTNPARSAAGVGGTGRHRAASGTAVAPAGRICGTSRCALAGHAELIVEDPDGRIGRLRHQTAAGCDG
jgi:hypothetical protein